MFKKFVAALLVTVAAVISAVPCANAAEVTINGIKILLEPRGMGGMLGNGVAPDPERQGAFIVYGMVKITVEPDDPDSVTQVDFEFDLSRYPAQAAPAPRAHTERRPPYVYNGDNGSLNTEAYVEESLLRLTVTVHSQNGNSQTVGVTLRKIPKLSEELRVLSFRQGDDGISDATVRNDSDRGGHVCLSSYLIRFVGEKEHQSLFDHQCRDIGYKSTASLAVKFPRDHCNHQIDLYVGELIPEFPDPSGRTYSGEGRLLDTTRNLNAAECQRPRAACTINSGVAPSGEIAVRDSEGECLSGIVVRGGTVGRCAVCLDSDCDKNSLNDQTCVTLTDSAQCDRLRAAVGTAN